MSEDSNLNTNPGSSITTVLFDLDDTLLNSLRAREDTLKTLLKAAGITLNRDWNLTNFRGLEIKDILRRSGVTEDELEEQFLSYRRIYWTKDHAPVELYGGVRPMLMKLRKYKIKMGVVTQKGRDFLLKDTVLEHR